MRTGSSVPDVSLRSVDQGPQAELILDLRKPCDGAVRIGTVSWSVSRSGGDLLPPELFLETLEQLPCRGVEGLDLLLASGRTLSGEPAARDVLDASRGTAVLFAVVNRERNGDPDGSARWLIMHDGARDPAEVLRASQVLSRRQDDQGAYRRFVDEVSCGQGVIRLADRGLTFVLFICGENNALRTDDRAPSAIYESTGELAQVLGGRWVALNPAHTPYWPQIGRKGFAKVGRIGRIGETMARVVARRASYRDGTNPAVAFIHANNFFAEELKTKAYASVAFSPQGKVQPFRTAEGEVFGKEGEKVHWLFTAYEESAWTHQSPRDPSLDRTQK
jgi:hypothetical protein